MSLFDPPSRSLRNDPSQDEMVVVRQLASHILNKIQDHLIILPNMVIASILLQNPRGMDLGQYPRICLTFVFLEDTLI